MSRPTTEVSIEISPAADDAPEEIQELTLRLREELVHLDVDAVDIQLTGERPSGAKVGDPGTWGAILIGLAASGGVLTTLIGAIQSWLTRNERRSIKLKIGEDTLEVTNVSSNEEARLIRDWIKRHSAVER